MCKWREGKKAKICALDFAHTRRSPLFFAMSIIAGFGMHLPFVSPQFFHKVYAARLIKSLARKWYGLQEGNWEDDYDEITSFEKGLKTRNLLS